MCGIVGFVGNGSMEALQSALEIIAHRGPDGRGAFACDFGNVRVGLGHVRLAIQELSPLGAQPMQSRDKRWTIVFNGEIYNHLELRSQNNISCGSGSDTETLVELLAAFGIEKTINIVNGIFAFGAIDHLNQVVHLVRDPFGIKPLYYTSNGGGVVFSSEVSGVLKLTGRPPQLSHEALSSILALRFSPAPDTLFREIVKVRPGHYVTIDIRTLIKAESNYVKPIGISNSGSYEDAQVEYERLLKRAVDRQLLSDVPVGLLLSGGIDSALIGALAVDAGARLETFSVGFDDGGVVCELADAAESARVLGLSNTSIKVSDRDMWDALSLSIRHMEEPAGTTSILPMWHLMRSVGKSHRVVLSGQGADELHGGYRRYQLEALRQRMALAMPIVGLLCRGLGTAAGGAKSGAVYRAIQSLGRDDLEARFFSAYEFIDARTRRALLKGRVLEDRPRTEIAYWLNWLSDSNSSPPLSSMMRIDARMNLSDDLLLYSDKISMASSIEMRVPMLDLELAAFVESLPIEFRVELRKAKRLHKAVAQKLVPSEIVHRVKRGFEVPIARMLRTTWKSAAEDFLLQPGAPIHDHLDREAIATIWRSHMQGSKDCSKQLFLLLSVAIWCERFLGSKAVEYRPELALA